MKMQLEPEEELVLLLAQFKHDNKGRIQQLLQSKLNWAEILGYLSYHRISGLAYSVLTEFDTKYLSGQAELCTKLMNGIQTIRVESIRKHIIDISEKLVEAGVPHAFLKGSVLASTLYPSGGRVSNDIDILLNQSDITRVGKILEVLGFQQGEYDVKNNKVVKLDRKEIIFRRMNWGEIVPYIKVLNEPGIDIIAVDINFSLDWLPTGTESAVEKFLNNTEKYRIGNVGEISSLDREAFLLHLCMHLYKEAILFEMVERLRDLDLYKFTDIYAYITDFRVDWRKFIKIAKENNLIKGCYYALEYTRILFPPLDNCEDFINAMKELKPNNIDFLDEVIDPARPEIKYIWQKDLIARLFDMKRYEKLKLVSSVG